MMYEYSDIDDEIHVIGTKSKIFYKGELALICCSLDEGREILLFCEKLPEAKEGTVFCSLEELTFDFADSEYSHIFEEKGKSERMDLLLSRVINYTD